NNGTLWMWGANRSGQLGVQISDTPRLAPVQMGTDTDWKYVETSSFSTFAIKMDGTLWKWGNGNYVPVEVAPGTRWTTVTSCVDTTVSVLGIQTDGTLWAFGYNDYGQLGDGTFENRGTPVQIGFDTDWQAVSIGEDHTLGLKTNGTLYSWGHARYGALGTGDVWIDVPTLIDGL
ncbi:MAG: chromosome condensation regulator RCC1, partial [Deltaproteobacteria bacterium]|nr:chromosome condensation regulator RCC1 [Deltaproteobacteria bacterium]